ncbi:MAG: peptidoglycan DD-metalloendopeptidase family protein [Porphyrobacter sp.]|nr:peptidoglycan DD-metalloendopeptidase family protein [Porphyrobacter sp.]
MRDAADKTAGQAAALAARIQEAEAGISAAESRLDLANSERARLREELGREQQPIAHLTAALQQFARRPLALSILRPGSVRETVYLRAMLDSATPQIEARTADLRGSLAQMAQLSKEAEEALATLRAEEARLASRQRELAALEATQRLALRTTSSNADREAERALALGEQARDLDALIGELDRAGSLRARLAALPGPLMRPARPGEPGLTDLPAETPPDASATAPPAPYLLPVTGRTIMGFDVRQAGSVSRGVTFAPRGGAQVVAPAAGRVVFAGPYRGYGRIVIIEHRGGWTSLVTGLARADVSVGESVVSGAPLGVAAQVDPRVTLELRRDGEPVNPLPFVG